jgi:hypothetical protein
MFNAENRQTKMKENQKNKKWRPPEDCENE